MQLPTQLAAAGHEIAKTQQNPCHHSSHFDTNTMRALFGAMPPFPFTWEPRQRPAPSARVHAKAQADAPPVQRN